NEKTCAEIIEKELKKFCNGTKIEEFNFTIAFLVFLKLSILAFIVAIIFYWFIPLVSICIIAFTWLIIYLEFYRYKEFIDPIFRKKKSQNVIGAINPKSKEVKNILILSTHHDTAYEYKFYNKNKDALFVKIGYLIGLAPLIVSLLEFIFTGFSILRIPSTEGINLLFYILGFLLLIPIPLYLMIYRFYSFEPPLGVKDNMTAISICLTFAKYLHDHRDDEIFPKNTQVRIISFGAEDAGLRGSKRYLKTHLGEFSQYETINLNLHLISGEKLLFLKKEKILRLTHSIEVLKELKKLATEKDKKFEIIDLPFGGTSAAVFSKNEIKAITISSTNLQSTIESNDSNNNEDDIKKESILNILELLIDYLHHLDS
ncbi:MAG: M28 family peptidase, partial [Promethearchaeota archaeon]